MLDLLRTAYPIAQGVVEELIDAVYNVLEFTKIADDDVETEFWTHPNYKKNFIDSQAAAELVAAAIRTAGRKATGGNGAPALLAFLDAEDVQVCGLVMQGYRCGSSSS